MRNLIIIILLSTSIGCVAQNDTTSIASDTLSTKMTGNILTKDTLSGTAAVGTQTKVTSPADTMSSSQKAIAFIDRLPQGKLFRSIYTGNNHGYCCGTGLSLKYDVRKFLSAMIFLDYNIQAPASHGSREYMHIMTLGAKLGLRL